MCTASHFLSCPVLGFHFSSIVFPWYIFTILVSLPNLEKALLKAVVTIVQNIIGQHFLITVGSHNITFSDSARNLGFILDSKLSMKKHIIKICQTAYFELKHISSVCRFLTEDAAKTLFTSYILSCLDYCNCLLMGTPNSVIQPLQKIQNFAARLVLLVPHHHLSPPLLEKLHWLPISEHIKYKAACMCFSAINGSGPAYLSELLHVYTPSHTLCSPSDTRMLEIQQYKRKIHGFHTFSYFGPHIWNSLPQDLRHCSTLSSFKAKLKTFLFSQYFHPNISTQFLLQSVCVFVVHFFNHNNNNNTLCKLFW